MFKLVLAAATAFVVTTPLMAQTAADSAAIMAPALDYIEGWERADSDRMSRGLHPTLTKIGVMNRGSRLELVPMNKQQLVSATARKRESNPNFDGRDRVVILDIFQDMATILVTFDGWVDHVQVARIDGKWSIVNVLWQPRTS